MSLVKFRAMVISDGVQAQRSMCQFWNPPDSGKVVRLTGVGIAFTSWPSFYNIFAADLRMHNTPIANFRERVRDEDDNELPFEVRHANCVPGAVPGHIAYEHWAPGVKNNQNETNDGFAPMHDIIPFDVRDLKEGVRLSPGQGFVVATAKPDNTVEPRIWLICNFQGYVET